MRPVRVFISYSRETPHQERRVRQLADRLRGDGLEVRLDQYEERIEETLTHWMEREMEAADYTLAVITEAYGRRQGTAFESHLMVQELFEAGMRNEKYVPVLFAEADARFIPRPLRGYRFFRVDTKDGYQELLRHLGARAVTAGATTEVTPQAPVSRPGRLSVWRISAAMALLITLVFLVFRLLPSGAERPLERRPAAPAITVSEQDAPRELPLAAVPKAVPRRKEPSPVPPPPSAKTLSTERIQVSGTGFSAPQYPSAQRKALARRAAEIDARRRLAETVATRIRAQTRVVKGNVVDDEILATVDQVVKGARIVGERELPDGGYEVTLEAQLSLGKGKEGA